jgi:NAD+--asparagine ADP-ribosyltransferase
MEPIADEQTTNDGNANVDNIHPNVNNHPINQHSDEDDAKGLSDHEMMDKSAMVETTTNDDHPISALANDEDYSAFTNGSQVLFK